MREDLTDDDAREAVEDDALRISADIQAELKHVLDQCRARLGAHEGPRSLRYLTAHAQMEQLGEDLTALILEDPERGKPWSLNALAHLHLMIGTVRTPTH
jgi:hypothetical protein